MITPSVFGFSQLPFFNELLAGQIVEVDKLTGSEVLFGFQKTGRRNPDESFKLVTIEEFIH